MKKGLIALVALAFFLPLSAIAQPGPGDGPFCPQGHGMMGAGKACQGHGPMGHGQCCKAGERPGHGDGFPEVGRLLMVADEIGLSEQQRDQLKKMQVEFRMQMIDREAELEKAHVRLRALLMDQNAPEAEVGRMIDDAARMEAEVQKLRYAHRKQMRAVLTDEQFEKLQKMREDRREKRMDMGQGPRPGGSGGGRHSMGGHK